MKIRIDRIIQRILGSSVGRTNITMYFIQSLTFSRWRYKWELFYPRGFGIPLFYFKHTILRNGVNILNSSLYEKFILQAVSNTDTRHRYVMYRIQNKHDRITRFSVKSSKSLRVNLIDRPAGYIYTTSIHTLLPTKRLSQQIWCMVNRTSASPHKIHNKNWLQHPSIYLYNTK